MSPWIAAIIALFVWWFSTGAILMAVKFADRAGAPARRNTLIAGVPLLLLGLFGLWWSLPQVTILGVYVGFLSALIIWGWIELAFLTGIITGPNPYPLPAGVTGWTRFILAWGTLAYHEILLAAALIGLFALAWDAPNMFGPWSFAVLFAARISAKLNLFFGVPRFHVDFLPNALAHLPSYFRTRPMNALFPLSITGLTFAAACWLERLYVADTPGAVTGFALLTALTVLALIEHWAMVAPVPDDKLWRWMLPRAKQPQKTEGGHHGL